MPDVDRLERELLEAGARWRSAQPDPPPVSALVPRPGRGAMLRPNLLLAAALAASVVGALAVGSAGEPGPSAVAMHPTGTPASTVPGSCPVTTPRDPGPLASQVAGQALPAGLAWYGSPDLWTIIPAAGMGSWWTANVSATGGIFIRTFWYSDRWSPRTEPSPKLSVAAGRLGGGQSVVGSPAINATSLELGTSMIASIDLPSGGCWQITGTYRDQSQSYVVWIPRDASAPIVSTATTLPPDVDGEPVIAATDAATALARTAPGASILVGGYLKPSGFMSCPVMRTFPDLWNVCFAIRLSPDPWSLEAEAVYRGTSTVTLPIIPAGQVEPVVLRVHSRDPGCPFGADCASAAVLDELVWQGRIGVPSPPTNTQPPSGLSREDAIRDAIGISFNNGGSLHPEVIAAVAGPYAGVQPEGTLTAGDRWVWLVTLQDEVPPPDCPQDAACPARPSTRDVVLDFLDGTLVVISTWTVPAATPR